MRLISGTDVRSAIAHLVIGPQGVAEHLGAVQLRAHQRAGASLARRLLEAHGGALIADDVGLGKTYTALAVARDFARPVVIGPASLRGTWAEASQRTRVPIVFASFESLARERTNPKGHDLVVIDEAHHLRTPTTKRFLSARAACANARVLLLSATPVQNRVSDLRVVLSLFLGERAHALSLDELGALIVRRSGGDAEVSDDRPTLDPPRWLHPHADVDCLDAILALPPPVAAADAGDAGALLQYSLVRQWASSRAALVAALQRRLARALALEDSLAHGRRPTRLELNAWLHAEGTQQLALPLLPADADACSVAELLDDVRRHCAGVRQLLARVAAWPDPDGSRAARLRELVEAHPGRRVVAFSEYTATVEALFRQLTPSTRVAVLTHAGGRLAHGRLTRADLLARFRPGARDVGGERERIDMLLSTDVLSEGVDLHDASIVVHLDLPWNPARLTQRVGRVRRMGSPESSVAVYAMAPPASAERMLALERRLRAKLRDAATVTRSGDTPLPGLAADDTQEATGARQRLASILASWRPSAAAPTGAVAGAVRATHDGALACVRRAGRVELIACCDAVTDTSSVVEELAQQAEGVDVSTDPAEVRAVTARITEWLRQRTTTDVIDLPARRLARSRSELLHRADAIARRAPLHARPTLSPLLLAARRAATVPLSAGAEQVLDALSHAPLNDSAWLQAIGQFAAIHGRQSNDQASEVLAVLLLRASV